MENLRRTNQIHVRAPCFRSSTGRAASSRLDIPGWPVPRLSAPSRQNPHGIRFAICFFCPGAVRKASEGRREVKCAPAGGKTSGEDPPSLARSPAFFAFDGAKTKTLRWRALPAAASAQGLSLERLVPPLWPLSDHKLCFKRQLKERRVASFCAPRSRRTGSRGKETPSAAQRGACEAPHAPRGPAFCARKTRRHP